MKDRAIKVSLVLAAVLTTLILGEFCLRGYILINPKTYYIDKNLGWRARGNYRFEGMLKDAGGQQYFAKVTTDSHGFRLFGNPKSEKIKIFVVGDSFTYAKDVGDNKTYYSLLTKRAKNIDIFAYGVIGYGTLQELMIINEFIDKIKPQIIILQFCTNDFFDNYYLIDGNSTMTRPYMDLRGNIVYRTWPPVFSFFIHQSQLARFTYAYLGKFPDMNALKKEIKSSDGKFEAFRESSIITKKIVNKIRNRASGVRVLTFDANETQPYNSEYKKIALSEKIEFIDGIGEAVKACEQKGFVTRAADLDHWNELGHKIVADKIYNYLDNHGYLANRQTAGITTSQAAID